ncbi:SDR family oxidoreductase [Nocardia vaccinii]|uniref:SDR family oxidoreductase n=1 Tax=Nocardia vaccinii TaxID=1822 RepID=UPI00083728AC|nr:SDR family oxidoreductase [Nocardia vaccinii]
MNKPLTGRVVVVTGGGRGLGRAHALELGRQGASVVINDLRNETEDPAAAVAEEIRVAGGTALGLGYDVADEHAVDQLFDTVVDRFGTVHAVVNNAGILRDKMLVNMSVEDWDLVMRVHLGGTFLMTRWVARYWRNAAKSGAPISGRVVNTTSAAGLFGNIGQANYASAKAGIASFGLVAAAELSRYGVSVNTLAPNARTRMTEGLFGDLMAPVQEGFDAMDPANAAPLVAWLCSEEAGTITGQVFTVFGGEIRVTEGWHEGPVHDRGRRWTFEEVGQTVPELVARARPAEPVIGTEQPTTSGVKA